MELIDIVMSKQYVKIKCKFLTTSCDYFIDLSTIEVQNSFRRGVQRNLQYLGEEYLIFVSCLVRYV